MEILSPDAVNKERKNSEAEANERTRKLAEEETRLTKIVNRARENAKKSLDEIEKTHNEFKSAKEIERAELTAQVEKLRAEKKTLLAPIDDIRSQAEAVLLDAQATASRAVAKEKNAEALHERSVEAADKIEELKGELDYRSSKLDDREREIKREEARQKASADSLAGKWTELHKAAAESNERTLALDEREAKLILRERATEIRATEQNDRQRKQNLKDDEIKDRYATLEKAIEEHRKNGII
jgi:hypothetical protein